MTAAPDEHIPERADNRLAFLVAALVGLEALLLLAGAVFLVAEGLTSDQEEPGAAIALAVVVLVIGAGLAFCARGVAHGLRWSRGPVLTWQLLQAGVGMPVSTAQPLVGVPLLAVAIVVGVLIAGRQVITQPSDRP
jgi:hypothetical protein